MPFNLDHENRILQFGAGNFIRAFCDWIVAELHRQTSFRGHVVVVKNTPSGDYDSLRNQQGKFHTLLRGVQEGEAIRQLQVVNVINDIIHPYQDYDAFLASATDPHLNIIISNTTEAGIFFDPSDQISTCALSFPGKVTQWLWHRFQHLGNAPEAQCLFLPCELIEDNATALKNCILQYAAHWKLSPDFTTWVDRDQIFCNTLVDRIVSGYPEQHTLRGELAFDDPLLAVGEWYHSWIIEGPKQLMDWLPFDQTNLNVRCVDDLQMHRLIKVRILNGAHTAMVPTGLLSGMISVKEVVDDETMIRYLNLLLHDEILPQIEFDAAYLAKYVDDTIDRFRNPNLHHKLASIALNSVSKFRTRLLPSMLAFYEANNVLPMHLMRAFAALLIFYRGHWKGQQLPVDDDRSICDFLKSHWAHVDDGAMSIEDFVVQVLQQDKWWGTDLTTISGCTDTLGKLVTSMHRTHEVFAGFPPDTKS